MSAHTAEDLLIRAATYRERYARGTVTRLLNALLAAEIDAEARLLARMARLSAADRRRYVRGRDLTTDRLRAMILEIQALAQRYRQLSAENIGASARELIAVEIEFQREYMALQGVTGPSVSVGQVYAAANARPMQGRHLRNLLRDQEASVRRTIERTIRTGFITGQTEKEIARTLLGSQSRGRRDALTRKHRRGAEMLARTAMTHYSARTSFESFKAIADGGYFGLAFTFDGRTSDTCRALSAMPRVRVQRMDSANPRLPPFHPNCRTSIYWLASRDEALGGEKASKGSSGPRPIDADMPYDVWLKRQSAAFQLDTLGRTQYELFKRGASLRGFVEPKTFRPLSAAQLRQKHRELWPEGVARAA